MFGELPCVRYAGLAQDQLEDCGDVALLQSNVTELLNERQLEKP